MTSRALYPVMPAPWTTSLTRNGDGSISGVTYTDGHGRRVPLLDVRETAEAKASPWLDAHGVTVPAPGKRTRKKATRAQVEPQAPQPTPEPIAAPAPSPAIVEPPIDDIAIHEAPPESIPVNGVQLVRPCSVCGGAITHPTRRTCGAVCERASRVRGLQAEGAGRRRSGDRLPNCTHCGVRLTWEQRRRKTCGGRCLAARRTAAGVASRAIAVRRTWQWWKRAWGAIVSAITWWRTR